MNKLSKKNRKIIKRTAKDSVATQVQLLNDKEKVCEEKIEATNCKIYYPTPEEKQTFQDAMAPIYAEC